MSNYFFPILKFTLLIQGREIYYCQNIIIISSVRKDTFLLSRLEKCVSSLAIVLETKNF